MTETKTCTKCGEEKTHHEFSWKRKGMYLRSRCKVCTKELRRAKDVADRKHCETCGLLLGRKAFEKNSSTCKACLRGTRSSYHVLSEINPTTETAICYLCGPVPVVFRAHGSNGGSGRGWYCVPGRKLKNARAHLLHRYGMTPEVQEQMLVKQDGRCYVCAEEPTERSPLCVDHDHTTGAVRAILCTPCNTSLGMARESATRLRGLAAYVEEFGPQ